MAGPQWAVGETGRMTTGATTRAAALGLALAIWAGGAGAITINDASRASGEDLFLGSQFPSVARLDFGGFRCSGSLISPTTVLTAEHCFRVNATTLRAAPITVTFTAGNGLPEVVRMASAPLTFGAPSFGDAGDTLLNGDDIAILTLDAPVLDRDPFLLFDGPLIREPATFVGFGRNGDGSGGAIPGPSGLDEERRAAQNVIETLGLAAVPFAGTIAGLSGTDNIITADFDDPLLSTPGANTLGLPPVNSSPFALELEGSTAGGDSGGPLLVERGDDQVIVGVLSGGLVLDGSRPSGYGDLSYWTSVLPADIRAFIEGAGGVYFGSEAVVPLPPSALLLLSALGAGALLARRRRRGVNA